MTSSASRVQLSEDQAALSLARRLKKQNVTSAKTPNSQKNGMDNILVRDWVNTPSLPHAKHDHVKVMTWNLLAQCLVRRELFPTSDCLKASQREGMLVEEILKYSPDIICLQEVDRLEKLLPPLHDASYAETYAAGFGKRHGCMVVHRNSIFEKIREYTVHYDDLDVRQAHDECERKGSTRKTKNIALIVALRLRSQPDRGYVVATTHLFWHPAFTYERTRQAGLLLREVSHFQKTHGLQDWTCIIAGDFNFTPTDPAYSLLVGDPLTTKQMKDISISRVIHTSIDPSVSLTTTPSKEEDEGDAPKDDPDRVITNARQARDGDGLLSDEELRSLLQHARPLRSVYDEGQKTVQSEHDNVIGRRLEIEPSRKGRFEPMWTSYTHYWKTTLDYIFIQDPEAQRHQVLGFLKTHRTVALQQGLPLRGVCGSDHISLVGEIGIAELEN